MLTKGIKASELWVLLLLIASQYFEVTGDQAAIVVDGVSSAQDQVAELAKQIKEKYQMGGVTPTWVALAYVVGRTMLKWRELGKG